MIKYSFLFNDESDNKIGVKKKNVFFKALMQLFLQIMNPNL